MECPPIDFSGPENPASQIRAGRTCVLSSRQLDSVVLYLSGFCPICDFQSVAHVFQTAKMNRGVLSKMSRKEGKSERRPADYRF